MNDIIAKTSNENHHEANGGRDFHHRRLPTKVAGISGLAVSGLILACLFALIFGLLVKWLWGVTLTPLFGLPQPSYWQAVGLIILGKLFFGSFGHHPPHGRRPGTNGSRFDSDRTQRRSPFDRENGHFRHSRHFKDFWETEGKKSYSTFLKKQREEKDLF